MALAVSSPTTRRTLIHVGLIATALPALVLEPVLTLHIVLGLVFVGLVTVHLAQRRRVSLRLWRRLTTKFAPRTQGTRLAVADVLLLALSAAMLASGLWDWYLGHPTKIRWHAITGVVLAAFLLVHTVRRRRHLVGSQIT